MSASVRSVSRPASFIYGQVSAAAAAAMSYLAAQLSADFFICIWVLSCTPQWGIHVVGALDQLAVDVCIPLITIFRHFLFFG